MNLSGNLWSQRLLKKNCVPKRRHTSGTMWRWMPVDFVVVVVVAAAQSQQIYGKISCVLPYSVYTHSLGICKSGQKI